VWEVYSLGTSPYPGVPNYEILEYLQAGHRLRKPKLCPDQIFAIVEKCWQWKSSSRPSISDLREELCRIAAMDAGYLEL
jgi:hypothetical protein